MRDKRVADLRSDAQFLRMLAAEAEHLVTISIQLPQGSMSEFQEEIYRAYASDGYSDVANEWNLQRRQVVNEAVEKFLIPAGIKHIREKVREDVEDQLITRCAHMLQEVCPILVLCTFARLISLLCAAYRRLPVPITRSRKG